MIKIIVLTGIPGTGKTTLASLIFEELGCILFNTNKLILENKLFDEWDEDRDTSIINDKKIKTYFLNFIKKLSKDSLVLVEGHYFEFIPEDMIHKIIILRTEPSILKLRLEERKFNVLKIKENIQAEILGNIIASILENYATIPLLQVDTSKLTIEESKKLIINYIMNNISSTNPSEYIDWLPFLEEKKELERYFD